MGNRAVIATSEKLSAPAIYLHWNGGKESVLAFLEVAQKLGVRDPVADDSYFLARLGQIIGNFFGGTLSVGVGILRQLDCENFDNGTYKVSFEGDAVVIEQSTDGKKDWKRLANCLKVTQLIKS